MTKRKTVKRVGNRRAWAMRFLLIALAAYLFLKMIQLYGQLREKQLKEQALDTKIHEQIVVNEALEKQDENADDKCLEEAYDNNYARPGEQIIVVQG